VVFILGRLTTRAEQSSNTSGIYLQCYPPGSAPGRTTRNPSVMAYAVNMILVRIRLLASMSTGTAFADQQSTEASQAGPRQW
jgi:hypothetical protein